MNEVKNTSIGFAIESHIGSPFIDPLATQELVSSVPGLSLTLDYTHFIREGYLNKNVDILLEYANHFHARGARKGYLQTSAQHNIIDYEDIIKRLIVNNYSVWIGLKFIWIDWENCNEIDTLSEIILLRDTIIKAYAKHI
ncbi:MAG: hypothetical protein HKN87_12665 [Saprospiraceae bacterium]|nr:hypothetical protein [Saprospiraceae bacterium]